MRTKTLILWVKAGDPPSERARLVAKTWQRVLPLEISLELASVNPECPEVVRVPCLQFKLDEEVVYCLEGSITVDAVLGVLRRLG
jgi:hypothetical protein